MRTILGPLPCRACRALVVFGEIGGVRMIVSVDTERAHACEPLPSDWSWRDLVSRYGEDEALVQLSRLRQGDYRSERERAYQRDYQRRRRAALSAAASGGS